MQLVCGCVFQVVGGNFSARTQKSGGRGRGSRHASAYVCLWKNFVAEIWIFREMFISVGAILCTTVDTCSSGDLEEFTHFLRGGGLHS